MRRLGLLTVVTLGLLIGGGASSVSAQVLPSIVLDPSTVEVGATFTVTGDGCEVEQQVELRIVSSDSITIFSASFPLTNGGPFAQSLTAPSTPGIYAVVADYDGGCETERTELTVVPVATTTTTAATTTTTTTTTIAQATATTAAPTTAAPATLPATGRSTDGLVWIALAISLLGGGLVAVAARRS